MKSGEKRQANRFGERGAVIAMIAIFMPTLLLVVMMATDGFVFVESDIQLANAVESAAEAGLCHHLENNGNFASTQNRVQNVLQKVWMITRGQEDLAGSIDILDIGTFDPDTRTFTGGGDWGNPAGNNALRLSVNHEAGSGNSITGSFTHLAGLDSVTLNNDMVAYRVTPPAGDYVYEYRFHHCLNDNCS